MINVCIYSIKICKNVKFQFLSIYEKLFHFVLFSRRIKGGGEIMSRIGIFPRRRKDQIMSRWFIWSGFILSLLLVISSIILIFLYNNANEQVAFTDKENPIIYEGKIFEKEEAIIKNEEVYLPFSFIKEKIDSGAIYDKETNSVIFATNDKVIQFPNDDLQFFVNEKPFSIHIPALVNRDGIMYIAAAPLFTIYPYKLVYSTETGAVILNKRGGTLLPGTVAAKDSKLKIKAEPGRFSPYVAEVSDGEKVTIEGDEQSYYFVRKNNGIAGYVKKEYVRVEQPILVEVEKLKTEDKKAVPKLKWPINLTWDAVYSNSPDPEKMQAIPGLNVISPTWFRLKNGEGDVANLASLEYVKWAKAKQYQVWGLFSNDFDPEKTHKALKDFSTRQEIIRQLLQYSNMYQLDGINLDFENVNIEDRDLLTQFARELTAYMHQAGLVVSMDITFISNSENWSQFYDREKLAKIVDYLIVMAYDEHWGNSPEAGSVASLPWVENNLKKLVEVVSNERLILGVPTYTRLWKEQTTPGGNIEVSSKAYNMDDIQKWIKEHGVTVKYDEKTGQDYGEYFDQKENVLYKVWLENEKSLKKRTGIVHQYQLGGIASWNRSFANGSAWNTIHQSLQQIEPVKK